MTDSVERSDRLDSKLLVTIPAEQIVRWKVVIATLVAVVAVVVGGGIWDRVDSHNQRQQIVRCTSPGEGHDCFDDAQSRTAEAIASIIDANGNGCPDVIEILNLLDPAHPQACGPVVLSPTPSSTPEPNPAPSAPGSSVPNGSSSRPSFEPPERPTTRRPPNRPRRPS